jgi:hypothetical protein
MSYSEKRASADSSLFAPARSCVRLEATPGTGTPGHRLTALLVAPMGAGTKTTSTQQPSHVSTKIESAKNFGRYR